MTLFIINTGLFLIALIFLLWVTRYKKKWYTKAKGTASLLFITACMVAGYAGRQQISRYFILLLLGLVLCAAGDVFLGLANKAKKVRAKPFLAGGISFMLAHFVFCALLFMLNGASWHNWILPILLWLVLYGLEKKQHIKLKKMRLLAYVYAFCIGVLAGKAIEMLWLADVFMQGILVAVGGVLFLISDIILLFLYFGVKRARWTRYANLTTYYIGVYCLAAGAYWL